MASSDSEDRVAKPSRRKSRKESSSDDEASVLSSTSDKFQSKGMVIQVPVKAAEEVLATYFKIKCEEEENRRKRLDLPETNLKPELWRYYAQKVKDNVSDQTLKDLPPAIAPSINPMFTQMAYGDYALVKLHDELESGELITKQTAAILLHDHLHDPENIEKAFKVGIIASLRKLLNDSDPVVREKSADCMTVIAHHPVGRCALLHANVLPALAKLFEDDYLAVRQKAHYTLEVLAEHPTGAQGVIQHKLIFKLLKKMQTETNNIRSTILETLHFCFLQDTTQALAVSGVSLLAPFLRHSESLIRAKTARAIMDLSVPMAGKMTACEPKILEALKDLLSDCDPYVRAKAAGALMMITILGKGKYAAMDCGCIMALLPLIRDVKFEVRLNAIKALTNLAEAPEGRLQLNWTVHEFEKQLGDPEPSVREALKIAINVIKWKP